MTRRISLIATDHRIELALLGPLDQVDAVFFQRLEFGFGALSVTREEPRTVFMALQEFVLGNGVELENVASLWNRPW